MEEVGLDVHPIFSGSSGSTVTVARPRGWVTRVHPRVAPVHPDGGSRIRREEARVMTQPDAADKATGARNMVQEEQSWNR